MKRTTISLPDDLAQTVAREAIRQRSSVSEVVRAALVAHFGQAGGRRHIPFASLGRSGFSDTATDMEDLLATEWGNSLDARDC